MKEKVNFFDLSDRESFNAERGQINDRLKMALEWRTEAGTLRLRRKLTVTTNRVYPVSSGVLFEAGSVRFRRIEVVTRDFKSRLLEKSGRRDFLFLNLKLVRYEMNKTIQELKKGLCNWRNSRMRLLNSAAKFPM